MGETYAGAGVDNGAGEEAVERIKKAVRSTFRPEVIGDVGGFGGLFAFDPSRYVRPVLVAGTMTGVTDTGGVNRFPSLVPGTYTVKIELCGVQNVTRE